MDRYIIDRRQLANNYNWVIHARHKDEWLLRSLYAICRNNNGTTISDSDNVVRRMPSFCFWLRVYMLSTWIHKQKRFLCGRTNKSHYWLVRSYRPYLALSARLSHIWTLSSKKEKRYNRNWCEHFPRQEKLKKEKITC